MSDPVSIERLGDVLIQYLTGLGCRLELVDEVTGEVHAMHPDTAGASDGALPVFLAAADAICLEATGHGIGLTIEPDSDGLLGVRVAAVTDAPFAVIMLSLLEASDRALKANTLTVTNLPHVAELARRHAAQAAA